MYVSDRKTSNILASAALLLGPWLGVTHIAWSWLLDVSLLLAVFLVGIINRERGVRYSALLLFVGYCVAAAVSHGTSSFMNMSFIPLAALVTLWSIRNNWPQRVVVLNSLIAVGILSLIPSLTFVTQGVSQESANSLISQVMEQYKQTGMLDTFQQQGLNESDIASLLQQVVNIILLVTPAFTVTMAFLKWGIVYYTYLRLFLDPERKFIPFAQWRLPWYAIWGINLAVASYLVGDISQWIPLKNFGINLMIIYAVIGLVLGCSIFVKFLKSPRLTGLFRGLLIFVSVVYINMTIVALILLGLFDIVLNFRKLPLKEDSNS